MDKGNLGKRYIKESMGMSTKCANVCVLCQMPAGEHKPQRGTKQPSRETTCPKDEPVSVIGHLPAGR